MKRYRGIFVLLALALVFTFTLSACGSKDEGTESAKEHEEVGGEEATVEQALHLTIRDEVLLDPQRAQYTQEFLIVNALMEGLVRLDENHEPAPGIAENWETTSDGMVWTFHLRDAKWSDGSAVTAQDFQYGWERALDPAVGSIYATIVSDHVKSVTAVDEKTLQVELLNPTPYFESLMSFQTFMPAKQEFVEAVGESYGTEVENLLFNGPFQLIEWEHNNRLVLAKNEAYWDATSVKLETITLDIVKDANTELSMYEEGTIDRINLARETVPLYQDNPEYLSISDPVVYYMTVNTKNEVLSNVNIRKALSYGFDRSSYCEVILNDGSVPAVGMVPPEVPGPAGSDFRTANGDLASYDLEKAQKFLAQGLKELGLEKLPALRYIGYDNTAGIKGAEFVKENYAKLGIDITVENLPVGTVKEKRKNGDFDLFFGGWGPDYWDPMTYMDLWMTDGPFNEGKWSNEKYDELIQFAKSSADADKRMAKLLEAEQILITEDAGIIPVYFKNLAVLQKPYVKNFVTHPFGAEAEWKWVEIEGK